MSRITLLKPYLDCGRPKGRTKSPRCARCRARNSREVARVGKRAQRERVWDSIRAPGVPGRDEFTAEELQTDDPELVTPEPAPAEPPRPAPPSPVPISHIVPLPRVEVRSPAPVSSPSTGGRRHDYQPSDDSLIDLCYSIRDRSHALEERLRMKDELKRRLPTASPMDRETILVRLRMVESELGE